MPRSKHAEPLDPALHLISLALRDDPLLHQHYDEMRSAPRELLALRGAAYIQAIRRQCTRNERLVKQICAKYKIPSWTSVDATRCSKEEWLATIRALPRHAPLAWGTNWGQFYSKKSHITYIPTEGSRWKRTDEEARNAPAEPVNGRPELTIRLDLSQVNGRDIERLARHFKTILKQCMKQVPNGMGKPSSTWRGITERDYRRFRTHVGQGVPFRWIAFHEKFGREPKEKLGFGVTAESSVRQSVERVHRILFLKPYRARATRREQLDARLAENIKIFNCPDHGPPDCPGSCSYARRFIKQYLR